jgi:Ca2+/Na+ antiporter
MDNRQPNPPRTTSIVWWIITGLSVFGIFAPELFGLELFSGGAAISAICILLAISGLIVAVIYTARARKLDKVLKGSNLLAHWTYSQEEWQLYTEEEYKRQKEGNKGLFIMIAVISLVIGIIYFIADRQNGQWVFFSMVGLIALIGFVAWFTAFYNYGQNKNNRGEVYFTPDAVYINRQLHDFKSLDAKLEKTVLKGDRQKYIEFVYSAPTRTGRQDYEARVPVPWGKDDEARELVKKYNNM